MSGDEHRVAFWIGGADLVACKNMARCSSPTRSIYRKWKARKPSPPNASRRARRYLQPSVAVRRAIMVNLPEVFAPSSDSRYGCRRATRRRNLPLAVFTGHRAGANTVGSPSRRAP